MGANGPPELFRCRGSQEGQTPCRHSRPLGEIPRSEEQDFARTCRAGCLAQIAGAEAWLGRTDQGRGTSGRGFPAARRGDADEAGEGNAGEQNQSRPAAKPVRRKGRVCCQRRRDDEGTGRRQEEANGSDEDGLGALEKGRAASCTSWPATIHRASRTAAAGSNWPRRLPARATRLPPVYS